MSQLRRCNIIPMPVSPIERLTVKFRNYLHLPDPSALYTLMGTVAANMHEGPPVWLMLVGPPSCGKSELLNSTLTIPHVVECADIGSESAFLSGSPTKDWAKDATGGIFRQVGDAGCLLMNDFTSVLCKPQDKINTILAILREAYGGRWTRQIGGDGGRVLNWTGKLAVMAGCTSRIDQHSQMCVELGERWANFRIEPRDDGAFAEIMMVLGNTRPKGWQDDLRATVKIFFERLDLSFTKPKPCREFTNPERLRIQQLGNLAVRCRSAVPRDVYSKEVIAAREMELGVRLSGVLSQLLIGMEAIGVPEPTRWKLLLRVAIDSMPRLRKLLIEAVTREPHSTEDLQLLTGCSLSVIKRVVEDLRIHGLVARDAKGKVILSEWMDANYRKHL